MLRDLVSGFLLLGFGITYFLAAEGLSIGPLDVPYAAADTFPKLIAIAISLLSLLLIFRALAQHRKGSYSAAEQPGELESTTGHGHAFAMLALGVFFVISVEVIGYIVATALLIAIGASFLGRQVGIRIVIVSLGVSLVLWAVFVFLLGVRMPTGNWRQWLAALS